MTFYHFPALFCSEFSRVRVSSSFPKRSCLRKRHLLPCGSEVTVHDTAYSTWHPGTWPRKKAPPPGAYTDVARGCSELPSLRSVRCDGGTVVSSSLSLSGGSSGSRRGQVLVPLTRRMFISYFGNLVFFIVTKYYLFWDFLWNYPCTHSIGKHSCDFGVF